jgi:hypothetical protein
MADPIVVELPNGVKFTVTSIAQALELAHAYAPIRKGSDLVLPIASWGYTQDEVTMALDFLGVIRRAGPDGADAEKIMAALRTKGKGIGGRSGMINGMLKNLGIEPDHVYDNSRTSAGRFWKAQRKLEEAIEAIRRRADGTG